MQMVLGEAAPLCRVSRRDIAPETLFRLSEPFRSIALPKCYRITGAFGPCSFLPLLYAEIIRSHLRRPGAQGLLVRFRAPSGNLRHNDVAIFDRWRTRE